MLLRAHKLKVILPRDPLVFLSSYINREMREIQIAEIQIYLHSCRQMLLNCLSINSNESRHCNHEGEDIPKI